MRRLVAKDPRPPVDLSSSSAAAGGALAGVPSRLAMCPSGGCAMAFAGACCFARGRFAPSALYRPAADHDRDATGPVRRLRFGLQAAAVKSEQLCVCVCVWGGG